MQLFIKNGREENTSGGPPFNHWSKLFNTLVPISASQSLYPLAFCCSPNTIEGSNRVLQILPIGGANRAMQLLHNTGGTNRGDVQFQIHDPFYPYRRSV